MRVFAADPNSEGEPTRCELRDRGELPGDGNGVAQRQQVEPDKHRQFGLRSEQRARSDEPIRARSDEEAHVITDAKVVDSRLGDATERLTSLLRSAVC